MSVAVSSMMPISLPRFSSASSSVADATAKAGQSSAPNGTQAQGGENGTGDMFDFDLLAEYLLDDGAAPGGMPAFDFGAETPPVSEPLQKAEVVSPEQAEASFVDPLLDENAALQEQMATVKFPSSNPTTASNGVFGLVQTQQTQAIQAAAAQQQTNGSQHPSVMIAQIPVAPAPSSHAQNIPVPSASPPSASIVLAPGAPIPAPLPPAAPLTAPLPVPAVTPAISIPSPVPAVPPVSLAPAAVLSPGALAPAHSVVGLPQHPILHSVIPDTNCTSNKRRRMNAPAPSVPTPAAVPVGAVMAMSGQILPQTYTQRGGRQKTQAQIDRRRERNRILARRTRLRKKFFFESLQKDVTDLQRENMILKEIVRTRFSPDKAKALLDECKAAEELPDVVSEQCGVPGAQLDRQDFNLVQGIQKSQQCFIITDPSLQDNPIVYASDDFLNLTGYSRDEVLGRNCRFLQGTETSPSKVAQIRKAVANGEDCTVTLINYTADGTAFWNNLFIAALRDAQNNIVNFIGVIVKVAGPDPGDSEAGKRLPGEVTPMAGSDAHLLGADGNISPLANSVIDAAAAAAAEVAEGTVKAIEGVVTAAVAAAPAVAAPVTSLSAATS
mmetsp:Transcript_14728/g.30207  ORF Transcript_14728/g.30207 Transcript_14728/m.30207 type:complete len:611 (-) Transcript_14728:145-1977(-)